MPLYVYENDTWTGGYLDETPVPGTIALSVQRQVALAPAQAQYFVRKPQLAMLASYVRMLGPRRVIRKVRSRRGERVRNDAWISVGTGVTEAGERLGFVLPSGPRALERVLVHEDLTFQLPMGGEPDLRGFVAPTDERGHWEGLDAAVRDELAGLIGWHPESGRKAGLSASAETSLANFLVSSRRSASVDLGLPPAASDRREHAARTSTDHPERSGFHCFGYGQYAKTQVIPNLNARLRLDGVHEINPLQIGPLGGEPSHGWDTSPGPRDGEVIVNAVVAGFHHTHAPLAVELIERGARHVIIEKPIATSVPQLDLLCRTLERHPDARVHVAFQRRYLSFNQAIHDDLSSPVVSMSATVFEVPLPERHWYRWPSVGNAVISNGCHWIDHFLYLNDYAPVESVAGQRLSSQVVLTIELTNGASCSISLRHQGSARQGVRDHCVYWAGDATVTIDDLRHYRAERALRPVRHRRAHPYASLENMYRAFSRRIDLDLEGDSIVSVRASAATTLDLARLVDGN